MENENETKRITEKLDFFLEHKIIVHIELKGKSFYNGILIEKESERVYVLRERKFGLMHIFVADVFDVDEYREEK